MVDLSELENDIEATLRACAVYSAENYGWLNEYEIDPDHAGYVMWWQDPPCEHDFDAWRNGTKPHREPTDREQRLMELGADFFGLMKVVRHSFGLALLYQPHLDPLRVDVTPFDIHEFTALTSLRAAIDPLRDFVIVIVFGRKSDERDELNRAYEVLIGQGLTDQVKRFMQHMDGARSLRNSVNTALHNIATEPGHVQRRIIGADRRAFQSGSWDDQREYASFKYMMRESRNADRKALAAVHARVVALRNTYHQLICAGDAAFSLEHEHRKRSK